MHWKQWVYLLSTTLVAGIGVFIAADLEHLTWEMLGAPKYILGSVMAMGVAVANYFKAA